MLFENKYIQQRIEKAEKLRESGINPYSNESSRNTTIGKFLNVNSDIFQVEEKRDEKRNYTVAGRIKFFRLMGKASFLKIEDESGILQIYVSRDNLPVGFYNETFKKTVEVGDIIEVSGYPFITGKGELSLHVDGLKILTKSISPLPEKYHGIQDKELRYRQRYLDLIMNSEVRKTFHVRSRVISLTRRFFENKGFLEVETPMMHPIAGGANAKPFTTHHNALGVDRFLRIAPELYLKRCIVGGFEAVFEINRCFRNEGMDATHNPEFTSIEFYWAYKTYKDLIILTKEYFEFLFEHLDLPTVLPYGDLEIDFADFSEIPLIESLTSIGGVPADITLDKEKIIAYLKAAHIDVNEKMNLGQLQGELFDEYVEDKLINPTFITEYPVEISPLARRNDEKPHLTDRFELFIAGKEIANAFSELNDPIDQLKRFEGQMEAKESGGDDEAHEMDEDFVNALSYGMAPCAGQGIGMDRLVMMLTNEHSIRDVLLFPAMKPIKHEINLHDDSEVDEEK
ncbi:lysine--tRNA ligase [Poseidonibacter ostreae]|uniref:Lysine--tRNA ligase n=1 Tax=Poseidonibacter ostreae TaxID=2654171 RepID=A0A6L4WU29_9BACT|nr:lysine--tRNA ligase [Poseidonibacter ostreae]KAB7889867.1 lysine--tRNA ligase [Poseidonibacter ostreae]KAB7890188.1 lysine--tRNA ligase [Poseidonibacter ostreae]